MTSTRPTRRSRWLAVAGAAVLAAAGIAGPGAAVAAPPGAATHHHAPRHGVLGPHVLVFDPSMSQSDIQARVDAIAQQQVGNQFGTDRYTLLFKPGTYGTQDDPLVFQVGYYTEVAGLGRNPGDVTINGAVNVYNQCDATSGCLALNNFWRSLSNLTINPAGGTGCRADTEFWAASQAAPVRRVRVNGTTTLMDYCTDGPQYASGGFIADSAISSTITSGSQQQYFVRNSSIGGWSNAVWNQVFAGVDGAPAQSFPDPPYTTLAKNPASREKPYLYVDHRGNYRVFVPAAQGASDGPTWASGDTRGRSLPLSSFYVARPGDSVHRINAELARGKNLLLTPGVYDVDRSIDVRRPGTVVLGLGMATLTAQLGAIPLRIGDVGGVDVAGLMIDAGPQNSPALLQIGDRRHHGRAHRSDGPTGIQDVFLRVGGPHAGRASQAVVVNNDDVILDDIWAWRADHGTGVGWTRNTARTGLVVNGDDVTATGLFVEHFQQDNVIWHGERGRTVFFQNELPYDAPNQAAWRHGNQDGYPAYRVTSRVRTHEAWGLGSYIYTNVDPSLHATNAFEVPRRPGVRMHDLLTVSLNKAGTIDHVINGVGEAVTPDRQGPTYVTSYP